ncbi:MAG TPA: PEP-CTERM sorting domain-containing protein [Chthoniobacterales bacterium]
MFTKKLLTSVCFLVAGSAAHAASSTFGLNTTVNGTLPVGGGLSEPFLKYTIADSATTGGPAGSVDLTFNVSNLSSTEYVDDWFFNLAPEGGPLPLGLNIAPLSSSGTFTTPIISFTTARGQIANAGYEFDVELDFETSGSGGGVQRFNQGDQFVLRITATNALSISDFLYTDAGNPNIPVFTLAKVNGIPPNNSGEVTFVPEPSSLVLFGSGLVWSAMMIRRKRVA